MIRFVTILLLSSALLAAGEEKKWRWGDGGDTSRQDREVRPSGRSNDYLRGPSPRYEIFENIDGPPGRPQDFRPPLDYQRPGPGPGFGGGIGPGPGFGGGFVPGRPGAGGLYGNGYGQGGHGGEVLTGPVPSYQEFDKCKCTEKFNCRGVAYGQCDVGKKYCCYDSHEVQGGHHVRPDYPAGHDGPGVLVGPGGPTGIVGRPPGYGTGPGVLVGPGGPTGVGVRPGYGGQGVLVGPGGPTGVGVRPGYGGQGVFVGPGGPTGVGVRPGYGGHGGPIGVGVRPGYGGGGGGSGVLVGPGGPTGIVGRPPGGYGGGFGGPGVLVGPGAGGYRPSGFGLGRSAKDVSRQNDESNEKE